VTQHDNSNLRKTTFANFKEERKKFLNTEYIWEENCYDSVRCHHAITQNYFNRDANIRYKSQYDKQEGSKEAKILIVKCFRRRV
jgi:hypothetical protein